MQIEHKVLARQVFFSANYRRPPTTTMVQHHVLVVAFPAQGHINPALQFAKRLTRIGVHVTFTTTTSACRRMSKLPHSDGLTLTEFSDGYDDGFKPTDDVNHFMSEMRRRGSQRMVELINDSANQGRQISCVAYTLFLPWAAVVARELHVPAAILWIQPATVLGLYYYYFSHDFGDMIRDKAKDPSLSINLPGLPLLTTRDLPSFLIPSNAYQFFLPNLQEQLQILAEETNPKVLVNTFDALEPEALKAVNKLNMIGIGPLIDPSDNSFGGDLFRRTDDQYIEWLDSKPNSSVVYVSFGSISVLSERQMEEIESGLLESGRPFLWVVRKWEEEKEEDKLGRKEELEKQGMIVEWCSQVEVLSHPAVGCFMSHCGWNSTVESMVSGVPVVAFPQWTDQGTNAKLIEDLWRTGVRVAANGGGVVEGEEIKRCLEVVMGDGERGEEIRRNAHKWKELAREAARVGGYSDKNLKGFLNNIEYEFQ